MKVTDLTGKSHDWKLRGYRAGEGHRVNSALHNMGRTAIYDIFPTAPFKEEVPINTGYNTLFLDFYLPVFKIAVEVHGEQHYKFIPHFHGIAANFLAAKGRDNDKAEWCRINGITMVVFPYNETIDDWKARLHRARIGEDEEGD